MINPVLFSSNTSEWATPQALFNELDNEFHFDLDPCSTDANAKCKLHYTIDNDGLTQNWGGGKCSAIRPTVEISGNGSRNATKNRGSQTLWS